MKTTIVNGVPTVVIDRKKLGGKKEKTLHIISSGGDWIGVFVNGEMAYQGHDIPNRDLVDIIQTRFYSEPFVFIEGYVTKEYDEKMEAEGCFPDDLADVDWVESE